MSRVLIDNLVRQLRELQEGSLWFDQCFREKTGHLTDAEVFTRPLPELHSVAEHISHILEWRKECLLRLQGDSTDLMNSPADWKDNNELRQLGWESLLQLFYESTDTMIAAIQDQDDSYLETMFRDTGYNFHYLVEGIIQHDLYHLGQIGVTLKCLNHRAEPTP